MMRFRRWRSFSGQSLVEFALIAPMLLLLLIGIAEFGQILYTYNVVTNAAQEGARLGSTNPGNTTAITNQVVRFGYGTIRANRVSITFPDGNGNSGSRIQVSATAVFTPVQFLPALQLHGAASMYIQ